MSKTLDPDQDRHFVRPGRIRPDIFLGLIWVETAKVIRVNVGTFGQCGYNRTLSYFLDNFSATSVVIALCNPDKSQ